MKTQIEKLCRLIREIEMDEYLNEETLPKIREAKGLLNTLHDQSNIASVAEQSDYGLEKLKEFKYLRGLHEEKAKQLTTPIVVQREFSADTMEELEDIWENKLMNNGWDVKKPIGVRFNWRKFGYEYYFVAKHVG